jgi:hypothetical protein
VEFACYDSQSPVGRCITRAKWQGCESQFLEGRQVTQRNEVINTGRCNLLPPINLPSSAFFLNPSTTKRHKFSRLFGSKMSLSILRTLRTSLVQLLQHRRLTPTTRRLHHHRHQVLLTKKIENFHRDPQSSLHRF